MIDWKIVKIWGRSFETGFQLQWVKYCVEKKIVHCSLLGKNDGKITDFLSIACRTLLKECVKVMHWRKARSSSLSLWIVNRASGTIGGGGILPFQILTYQLTLVQLGDWLCPLHYYCPLAPLGFSDLPLALATKKTSSIVATLLPLLAVETKVSSQWNQLASILIRHFLAAMGASECQKILVGTSLCGLISSPEYNRVNPKAPISQEITCHFSQDDTMVTKILDFIHKHLN